MSGHNDMDWLYTGKEKPRTAPPPPQGQPGSLPPTSRPRVGGPSPDVQAGPAANPGPQERPRQRVGGPEDPNARRVPPQIQPAPGRPGAASTGGSAPWQGAPAGPGAIPGSTLRHPAGPRPPRRRRIPFWAVLALIPVLIIGYYVYAPLHAWSTVTKIKNVPDAARPADQPGTAFLLVGTDARDGLSDEEGEKVGVKRRDDKGRTDSMMLLYTPPSGKSVLISLPRDTYVNIKGFGPSKLNGAYSIGGPKLLTQTVEQLTGLRVKGYAEVGFGGFARLVEATNGLDICVEKPIPAEMGYEAIKAGCQHLDTKQAMWYVRNRHSEANQDLGRITRQRKFISAMMKDAANPATFLSPMRYWDVTHSVAGAVGVGEETGLGEAWAAFNGMKGLSGGGVSMTVPISNGNAYTEVGSSVVWDAKRCKEMFGQLRTGSTENIERFKDN